MEKYETSAYLSVALNYDLARDWWDLSEAQHHFVYDFLHDWDNFENWLAEHKQPFDDYKSGGKARQKTIKNYPEHYPLFVYAHWLHLQNGALLNTLLARYGYAESCSRKGAYEDAADFFELLLGEFRKLNILPPTAFDAGAEAAVFRKAVQTMNDD